MINFKKFYTGCYAIYAKGLDRFILVDNHDLNVTFQTAELLSSKVSSIVYSVNHSTLDNSNCFKFHIIDKTKEKIGYSSILVSGQTPVYRFIDHTNIQELSTNDNDSNLNELIEYANFVHQCSHAVSLIEKIFNNNSFILKKVIQQNEIESLTISLNTMLDSEQIFFKIRQALYISDNKDTARNKIESIWNEHSNDRVWMKDRFYKILQEESPQFNLDIPSSLSEYLV